MAALEQSYEVYLELNGGREECAICGAPRRGKRLDRDHNHLTGKPQRPAVPSLQPAAAVLDHIPLAAPGGRLPGGA